MLRSSPWMRTSGLVAASTAVPRCAERQQQGRFAQAGRDPQPPAVQHQPALRLVVVRPHPVQPRIGELRPGPAQRDELRVPGQDLLMPRRVQLRPVQLRPEEGLLVLRVGHLGGAPAVRAELQPAAFGDRRGQRGVDVVGEVLPRGGRGPLLAHEQHGRERRGQHQARAHLDQAGGQPAGDPVAGGPVADLVVILQVAEEAEAGDAEQVHRPAMTAAAERGVVAVVEEDPGQRLDHGPDRAEVAVVALPFPGDRRVHRVMEVIAPLGREAEPAGLPRADQPRVVEVRLGDEDQLPVQQRAEGLHLDGQLLEEVQRAVVLEGVHRVEPQPVQVVVAQPHQRVADQEAADLVGAGLVQVDRGTPGGHVRLGEVGPEVGQPVADADVVVDHVEQDGQPGGRGTRPRTASGRPGRRTARARPTGGSRRSPSRAGRGTRPPASARSCPRPGRRDGRAARWPRRTSPRG